MYTWAYLLVGLAMTYELAGEVVRASALSAQLRADEHRWRSLLESVELLVAGVDRSGRVDYVNPYFSEVTGYAAAELMGKPVGALLSPDEREAFDADFDAAMRAS